MKITLALLLFSIALVRADVAFEIAPPDPDDSPAEDVVELTPAETGAADLILKGDARALAGDREEALSLWSEACSQKDAGEKQKRDAIERLQWACPASGIGGLGSEKPGQAFAFFRRDSFLGANEALRKRFISEFCDDTEHNHRHPEFDAYAEWLQKMVPEDKNFELLPLMLEGDLAGNQSWQAQVMPDLSNYEYLLDPDRALQVVKLLGGNKAGRGFNVRMLHEEGEQTHLFKIIDRLTQVRDGDDDKYERTRETLKKFLASLPVTTLDSDLMLTLLQWKDDKALDKFLTKHGSKLAALEPEHLKSVLQILERMKGCPNTSEMDELQRSGDLSALAGERKEALANWSQVRTLAIEGIVPRPDALERLRWARGENGTKKWETENPGRAFAHHMRDQFLGEGEAHRREMIKKFCQDHEQNESDAEFEAYANWLRSVLAKDLNLEVLPLVLEDALSDNRQWQSGFLGYLTNHEYFLDPKRTIKAMQILGFLGDAGSFNARPLDQDGRQTAMAGMILGFQNMNSSNRPALETLKKHLEERQPRTFGADLVLALLDNDKDKAMAVFLTRYNADLTGMNQDRRQEVLSQVKANLKGYPNTEEMDDAIMAALRPLLPEGELKTLKLEDQLAEILSPDKWGKENNDDVRAAQAAASAIASTAQKHPRKAITGLKKAVELLKDSPTQKNPAYAASEKPLAALLQPLLLVPDLFSAALMQADEAGILADGIWTSRLKEQISGLIQNGTWTGKQVVAGFFASNCFVGEAEDFQPVLISQKRTSTLLGGITRSLLLSDTEEHSKLKQETLQLLRTQEPRTFGSELVAIMISQDAKEAVDFIRRRSADFSKIPPDRRSSVHIALRQAWMPLNHPEKPDPELKAILQPLLTPDPTETKKQLERFFHAPSLASLNYTPESCLEPSLLLLDEVAQVDIEKAVHLVHVVGKLIRQSPAENPKQHQQVLNQWRALAAGVPELFPIIIEENEKAKSSELDDLKDEAAREANFTNSPERTVKFLQSGHFLEEAASFRAYCIRVPAYTSTFLSQVAEKIQRTPQTKAAVSDFLKKQRPTFGVEIVQALLEDKPDGMLNFIKKRGADLEKIPAEHHQEITILLGLRHGSWLQLATASQAWSQALQPLLPGQSARVIKECDRLLAANRLEDIEPTSKDFIEWYGDLLWKWLDNISEMTALDPKRGSAALEHLLQLVRAAEKQINESGLAETYIKLGTQFPALVTPCIIASKAPGIPQDTRDDTWRNIEGMALHALELATMMAAAGFLGDAENFDPTLSMPMQDWTTSQEQVRNQLILPVLIMELNASGMRRYRNNFLAFLTSRQPQTFGSDFVRTLLEKDSAASVSAFLKAHQADLARLPADSRKPVLDMLRKAWPKMPPLK